MKSLANEFRYVAQEFEAARMLPREERKLVMFELLFRASELLFQVDRPELKPTIRESQGNLSDWSESRCCFQRLVGYASPVKFTDPATGDSDWVLEPGDSRPEGFPSEVIWLGRDEDSEVCPSVDFRRMGFFSRACLEIARMLDDPQQGKAPKEFAREEADELLLEEKQRDTKLLNLKDFSRKIGLSYRTLKRMKASGELPQPKTQAGSRAYWTRDQIDEYIKGTPTKSVRDD